MTICFRREWWDIHGRPRAVVHEETKNKSFLYMAAFLEQIGIKNNAFHLSLFDEDLRNIDVHKDLNGNDERTEVLRGKVMQEAACNGWYFLREVVRVYQQGGDAIPFQLNRGNLAMAWSFFSGIDYFSEQPRQTGKDQPLDALILSCQGWVTMGSLKLGQLLVTPDGKSSPIIGIYPQGKKAVYQVVLNGNISTRCGVEHLWKVYRPSINPNPEIVELSDILQNIQHDTYIPVYCPDTKETRLEKLLRVVFDGYEETQCIEIDHPDHLYITDNYIVTHNTVGALCLAVWVMYGGGSENFEMGMMAKDNSLRVENIARVKKIRDYLPSWWLFEDKFKDKNNQTQLHYHAMETTFTTFVAQKEPGVADQQARGASPSCFWFDELAYCYNIDISYSVILSSTDKARENAKLNGKPSSNIITTTAGDPSRPYAREAYKILEGATAFSEHLYDLSSQEELERVVQMSSPQKMLLGIFSHLQLGYTNAWLREKIQRNRLSKDKVARDYLNRWISFSEESVIPQATLNIINSSQLSPKHVQIFDKGFAIYWYINRSEVESAAFKNKPIIMGTDTSDMIGRDATTLVGIDPTSMKVLFSFRCNEGNLTRVGVMIAKFLLLFPKTLWVPENKMNAQAMIDSVTLILRNEGHNPFKRIFNWVVNNRSDKKFASIDITDPTLADTELKRLFGIKTDSDKRNELYRSTLIEAATLSANRIYDQGLIRELGQLTVRNSRIDHTSGGHDDTVMAWLMACWVLLNGKHLDIYGIRPGTALSEVKAIEGTGEPTEEDIEREKHQLEDRLEEMTKELRLMRDPSTRILHLREMDALQREIDKRGSMLPGNADELMRDPDRFTDKLAANSSRDAIDLSRTRDILSGMLNLTIPSGRNSGRW